MYMGVLSAYMSVHARPEEGIPWDQSDRGLLALLWVLGIKSGYTSAISPHNCWAIFSAL